MVPDYLPKVLGEVGEIEMAIARDRAYEMSLFAIVLQTFQRITKAIFQQGPDQFAFSHGQVLAIPILPLMLIVASVLGKTVIVHGGVTDAVTLLGVVDTFREIQPRVAP